MISRSGTFDYLVIIPEARSEGGFECRSETYGPTIREESSLEGSSLMDTLTGTSPLRRIFEKHSQTSVRLVGHSPSVRVTDAGPPSAAGLKPPWSLRKRSCITLVAAARDQASVAEASFYIDKKLTDCAKPGDQMHLSRNAASGLGFSLLRDGKLVAAAGAITAVPLGRGVEVRIPRDLISTAESVFQQRDQDFKFIEEPVEIRIEGLRERRGQSLD